MRVKSRGSRHEVAAERALRRSLEGTDWLISANVSLQSVLDKDRRLSPEEFSLYSRGHFDWVICRAEDHAPEFAIEFDGFGHEDPRQLQRDIIKNRLCSEARLPLLRIGVEHLEEREQVSVLEWLLDRFTSWELETPEAVDELAGNVEFGGDPSTEELAGVVAATFSSEFPFPGSAELARRLYRRFRVGLSVPESDDLEPDPLYALEVNWPGVHRWESAPAGLYVTSERAASLRPVRSANVLTAVTGRARFTASNRTGPDLGDLDPTEVPWLDPQWIVMDLALYDALEKAEKWARAHLRDFTLSAH